MSRRIYLDSKGNDITDETLRDIEAENSLEEDSSNSDGKDEILTDLDTAIVLTIPDNTTKITLEVEMIDENNNIQKAVRTMLLPEIVESRIEGSYWADENVKYRLVEQ